MPRGKPRARGTTSRWLCVGQRTVMPSLWEVVENAWNRDLDGAEAAERFR